MTSTRGRGRTPNLNQTRRGAVRFEMDMIYICPIGNRGLGAGMAGRRQTKGLAAIGTVAIILGVATPSLAADRPAQGSQIGVTATQIRIGQVDTLTGPDPGLFEGAKDGTEAYLDYINSKGGVNGRQIELDVGDDAFSGANYKTETAQLVTKDFALVGGFSLFDDSGVASINAAKIPDVTESLSAARALDEYNYAPDPLIVGGTRLGPFKYYKKEYPNAIKHVGTLYSSYGAAEVQTKSDLSAMASLGYHVDYSRVIGLFDSDFTADVLKMRAAGVQMVYIVGMQVSQLADLAKNMAAQGFKPQIFSTNGVGYDSSYIPAAGDGANGTETDLQSALFQGEDAKSVPAVALFDKWLKKANPQAHVDTYALYGWAAAELFTQALQAAGKNPTRAGVLAQLNKITTFSANGLLAPGNPAQKTPENCWLIAKVQNDKWVRTSPSPKTGYVCNPGGYFYPKGYKKFVRSN
jgi:branched-chain amino acid transport system substrate-binding protein